MMASRRLQIKGGLAKLSFKAASKYMCVIYRRLKEKNCNEWE